MPAPSSYDSPFLSVFLYFLYVFHRYSFGLKQLPGQKRDEV